MEVQRDALLSPLKKLIPYCWSFLMVAVGMGGDLERAGITGKMQDCAAFRVALLYICTLVQEVRQFCFIAILCELMQPGRGL